MTARPPAPALSPAEAARLSRPAVDIAADVRKEELAALLVVKFPDYARWDWLDVARAALAAVRPPADDAAVAVERVRAVLADYDYAAGAIYDIKQILGDLS